MLRQKLQDDSVVALKSGNKEKLSVIRFIIAQIKNQEIDKFGPVGGELNDEEIMIVLRKFSKELKESIDAFEKGNRAELVTDNKKQLDIVLAYLPKEIDDVELNKEIVRLIEEKKRQYQPVFVSEAEAVLRNGLRVYKGYIIEEKGCIYDQQKVVKISCKERYIVLSNDDILRMQ